jgi:hypothetical protein
MPSTGVALGIIGAAELTIVLVEAPDCQVNPSVTEGLLVRVQPGERGTLVDALSI